MLIKHVIIFFLNLLFLLNNSAKAEVSNYIHGNNEYKITQRIDSFFTKHPNSRKVFWQPEIKGKSRYAFSIPKDAYLNSKKYLDTSDLYYLSQKIDRGLKSEPSKFKKIDVYLMKDKFNLIYNQNHFSGLNTGIFFEKKDNSFGIILNKDFITSKNSMAIFGLKQAKDDHTVFNAKFLKLSTDENSEFYGDLKHEFSSDILNVDFEYTWFEIANQFDFTVGIQEQDKKVESEIYSTFGDENIQFQIGLSQIRNNSKINMFFNLKFENAIKNKNLGTNVTITSKDNIYGLRNSSLKSFRKKNLDVLWKKYMNYN